MEENHGDSTIYVLLYQVESQRYTELYPSKTDFKNTNLRDTQRHVSTLSKKKNIYMD